MLPTGSSFCVSWLTETVGFKEDDGRDMMDTLDKVLADEEAADRKGRTGTSIRSI